jgi:AcrR family transcriptional regulator
MPPITLATPGIRLLGSMPFQKASSAQGSGRTHGMPLAIVLTRSFHEVEGATKTNRVEEFSMLTNVKPAGSKQNPRDRLMEAAFTLFCQNGINAVGVDAIVEKAGTAKTTLYKLFGSKYGLVEEVLNAEGKAWRDWFMSAIESAGPSAREKLGAIFPVLSQWFREESFYGCPFINAVGEHDKSNDRIRSLALNHKRQVLAYIRSLSEEAGAADPGLLTHEIALLIDGAIVAAMVTRDASVANAGSSALSKLLEAHVGR